MREHRRDAAISYDGTRYVVRAAKRFDTLTGPGFRPDLEPASWLVAPVLDRINTVLMRRVRTWQVGVLREQPRRLLGNRLRLLHREVLPRDVDPAPRMNALMDDVRRGRFAGR